jgi:acyl carrier protein
MSTPTTSQDDVLAAIREELEAMRVPGGDEVEASTTWKDIDLDSLELVELVKALEDRYGVQIADERLKSIASVGDAMSVVTELVGA